MSCYKWDLADHTGNSCQSIDNITRECRKEKTHKRCDGKFGLFYDAKASALDAKSWRKLFVFPQQINDILISISSEPKTYFMPVLDKCVETNQDYIKSGDIFQTKKEC